MKHFSIVFLITVLFTCCSKAEKNEITAETVDGIIMGIQHKKYNLHGVQFHPESIKTPIGMKILKNFITFK